MPNLELDFPLRDGRKPLPGYRLRRLEMLNWGTFHEKVAVLVPDGRWTLLVGENGSGKSTAVDALRTLLVPPRSLNYNDASGEQKRRDRSRRSYVRGTFAVTSGDESGTAMPQNLRGPGEYSILLAVFANEHTNQVVTLGQVLWELNEKIEEVYAVARVDRSIRDHLGNLGPSRELKKTLRARQFEPFDSFSGYSERFRSLLGIANEVALEVFNQAIGVKEVLDINQFIRRHMLEGSDVMDFIHNRLRPHYSELDACWRAIERAQKQLDSLAPIADCHRRIQEAVARREQLERLLDAAPAYYANIQLGLRQREAETLASRLGELNVQKMELEERRRRDESERDAKLQEIAADTTQQSIHRIESQMEAAGERLRGRQQRWSELAGHLRTLERFAALETEEQFNRTREEVERQRGLLEGNRGAADDKRVNLLVEKQQAESERESLGKELQSLREKRVLIPSQFVTIREAVCTATRIHAEDLPFAGELIEVKSEFREWTGAIERLLHSFGVSLLVPERHYLVVARFINDHHLTGIRFTFHKVPPTPPRPGPLPVVDDGRVAGRLNYRDAHALAAWVRSETARRFNHLCCPDVARLKEVDYGVTREGLIRDGATRHTKDDRRSVNDATNFVLGWSLEGKVKALTAAFQVADRKASTAVQKATELGAQVKALDARLSAVTGVLSVRSFSDVDFRSVQVELSRLTEEKRQLEASSEKLLVLKGQLQAVMARLKQIQEGIDKFNKAIGSSEESQKNNSRAIDALSAMIAAHASIDPPALEGAFLEIQGDVNLTIASVGEIEGNVVARLRRQISSQEGACTKARDEMLPKMAEFLRDYPEHTSELKAETSFAPDFAALSVRIDQEQLPQHRERFERFLGENLVGDTAMFNSKLSEHEKSLRMRVGQVNSALRKIPFTDTTHVQIVVRAARGDEVPKFRAELRDCLSGGLNPAADDRLRIFGRIRELMTKFERDDVWTRRVTDARNWLEFNLRETANSDGREVNFYSASSGKSGGQKARLAFTVLASAIAAQYGLVGAANEADTFRLVVIDEAFARTDETNSQLAMELFKSLGLQLVVVNPFDAKGRIVEDYVNSFHLAVNPTGSNSKLCRASRAEYEAARIDGKIAEPRPSIVAASGPDSISYAPPG